MSYSPSSLSDYHLHSDCSRDGTGKVAEHCFKAVERGFTEICFTNHQEWISVVGGYYDYAMRNSGWEKLITDIEEAKKKFPTLSIKLGCEIGHYPQYVTEIIHFTEQFPFDFIIASIHSLDGLPLAGQAISKDGKNDKRKRIDFMRRYLSAINEMVEYGYFDCIGHLDYAKKNMLVPEFEEYEDLIVKIAESMKKNNIGFELNTSGWQHFPEQCYPSVEVLKLFNSLGIKMVSVGSDSHSPETVGQNINKGLETLSQAGFDAICSYSERIVSYQPLPNFTG